MKRINLILIIPFLAACVSQKTEQAPWFSNDLYTAYTNYDKKTYEPDSIIIFDKYRNRSAYLLESESIGSYPKFYKDRLVSLIPGREHPNLVSFHLKTHQTDTICSNILFLTTSSLDAYDRYLVIRDYDRYGIVEVERKRLLKESKCYMENILLTGTNYFLVRTLNDISEPKLFLCKGSIYGREDLRLIDLPGMGVQHYTDATTHGWNGMAIYHDILFIHTMHEILAYDIRQNRIVDQIPEQREIEYKVIKSTPVFQFEKEKIVFDEKKQVFRRS